jgi:putative ABC transport system permease protein
VQFTISVALIIGSLVIMQQIGYMRSAELGFDKEQVVIVKGASSLSRAERNAYLNTIRQVPGVRKAADANLVLGQEFATTRLRPRGSEREQQLNFATVGLEYFDVMGIRMKEGRGFSPEFPGDTINNGIAGGPLNQTIGSIVINEQAVKDFGLKSPVVGQELLWNTNGDTSYYVKIIGVAKDFHFTSLRNAIKPFGFLCFPGFQSSFSVKIAANNIPGTLEQLATKWKQFSFERPFEYFFLDDSFAKLYDSEARFQKVFIGLVILGIFISCLGLLGLATYAAQQRVKEIGIRKTLGASVANVVLLLSRDFIKLVIIALFIAVPIAWYAMERWLQDFAYRIEIEWWIFILASIIAIGIAFLTISFHTIRVARANPVKSLRTE